MAAMAAKQNLSHLFLAVLVFAVTATPIHEISKREISAVDYDALPDAVLPTTLWECDFNSGLLCGAMRQDLSGKDQFDWSVGVDSDTVYAPPVDAGNSYLFFDGSTNPIPQPGESAKIQITRSFGAGHYCVWFKTYMKGYAFSTDTARIRLYAAKGIHSKSPVFELASRMDNSWNQQRVDVYLDTTSRLWFEGVFGHNFENSKTMALAIDDMKVTEGKCPHHQYMCDFEDKGLCEGIIQNKLTNSLEGDEFDWLYNEGPTPTSNTGPTQAFSGEGYMYIESSSPRIQGDTAILQLNKGFTLGNRCLSFAFHMYGHGSAEAAVKVYTFQEGDLKQLIWSYKGRHDDVWMQAQIDVNHVIGQEIWIEGVRGSASTSDVAIDLLTYDHGACPTEAYSCSFEDNDYCEDMQASYIDNWSIGWFVHNGTTPTTATGPEAAAAGDYYAYCEASSGPLHSIAHLRITQPFGVGQRCLKFKYHMYGRDFSSDGSTAALRVYQSIHGDLAQPFWEMTFDQGKIWHQAEATIDSESAGVIIFEGQKGSGSKSDIGLDDIHYDLGACPDPPADPVGDDLDVFCGFEPYDANCDLFKNVSFATAPMLIEVDKTPTGFTGPESPYEGAYYAYFEGSNVADGEYSTIEIDHDFAEGPRCLSFKWNMVGEQMGTLTVYQAYRDINDGVALWQETGNHTQEWFSAEIDIQHEAGRRIWLLGKRLYGSRTDMALDSISYLTGNCASQLAPPTGSDATTFRCSFEDSDPTECQGWDESTDDYTDWTVGSGKTPSGSTGPHTGHSHQQYLFFEASGGRSEQANAIGIINNTYTPGDRCLKFSYHMFGSGMGALTVFQAIDDVPGTALWQLSGDQGIEWHPIALVVSHNTNGKIWFEATKGTTSKSDMAIDSIEYFPISDPAECTW